MPDSGWWRALWPDPARVLTEVGVTPGMTAVDLCCGDGWFTLPLADIAAKVTAIDIDAELLQTAKMQIPSGAISRCEFVLADAYDLNEVIRDPVDHIFLANAFHGVPDKPRLARAVCDVLKPGGLFAVVGWHARPREQTVVLGEPRGPATDLRMTPGQTIAAIEPGGLRFSRQVEVSPYHYGVVLERPR